MKLVERTPKKSTINDELTSVNLYTVTVWEYLMNVVGLLRLLTLENQKYIPAKQYRKVFISFFNPA